MAVRMNIKLRRQLADAQTPPLAQGA